MARGIPFDWDINWICLHECITRMEYCGTTQLLVSPWGWRGVAGCRIACMSIFCGAADSSSLNPGHRKLATYHHNFLNAKVIYMSLLLMNVTKHF